MSIEKLVNVLRLPKEPIETGDWSKWPAIEQSIGISLPTDYKKFINKFGSVDIGKIFIIYNPFSSNKYLNLVQRIDEGLYALRYLKKKYGDSECPYALFPESDGLLPWGISDNGDGLYWLTKGHPDNWIIVLNEARDPEYEEHNVSLTGFLTSLISGKANSNILPFDFLDQENIVLPIK